MVRQAWGFWFRVADFEKHPGFRPQGSHVRVQEVEDSGLRVLIKGACAVLVRAASRAQEARAV